VGATELYDQRFSAAERAAKARLWAVLCGDFLQRYVAPSDAVLDLGAGFCEFINHIACARKFAVDSDEQVRDCAGAGVQVHVGPVHQLGWLADGALDVVFASNLFEHLPSKELLLATLGEVHRVLRPGGRLLVLDTDWDSIVWNTSDRQRTSRMLTAWKEHVVHPHLPRTLARRLKDAGFVVEDVSVFTLLNSEYGDHTVSHGLIALIAAFVSGRQGITDADVAAWAADLRELGTSDHYFFSLNRYLFLARNP